MRCTRRARPRRSWHRLPLRAQAMQFARTLLAYILAVGVLFSTLAGGVIWLVKPAPAVSQEARPAPLPQRMADSIERKKPFPVQEPTIAEPKPVKPAMQEADVSLAPAPA